MNILAKKKPKFQMLWIVLNTFSVENLIGSRKSYLFCQISFFIKVTVWPAKLRRRTAKNGRIYPKFPRLRQNNIFHCFSPYKLWEILLDVRFNSWFRKRPVCTSAFIKSPGINSSRTLRISTVPRVLEKFSVSVSFLSLWFFSRLRGSPCISTIFNTSRMRLTYVRMNIQQTHNGPLTYSGSNRRNI